MPASNDNFANAISLNTISDVAGVTSADNTGATGEPGEPPSSGRTLWWKWTVPTGRSDRYRFSTRQKPGLQQTGIRTTIQVFSGTAFNNLVLIGGADSYAGWEQNGEVIFQAGAGTTYYIRVDGYNGAQGFIALWWEPADELVPWNCGECLPVVGVGETCMGTWQPSIFSEGFKDFNVPAGAYIVRYCGGAWNYRDGWVVGRVPPFATQSWPGIDFTGWFFSIRYRDNGAQMTHLGEPGMGPPDTNLGYPSPGAAQAAAACNSARFRHDATAPITMHFTDQAYPDNTLSTLGIKAPLYTLYRVVPVLIEDREVTFRNAPLPMGNYSMDVFIDNLTDEDFNGVIATLQTTGGVTTVAGPKTLDFPSLGQGSTTFFFTVSPGTNYSVIATIKLSDGINTFQDLHFDLNPRITSPSQTASTFGIPGTRWKIIVDLVYAGIHPFQLFATVEASGGVTDIRSAATTAPQTVFPIPEGSPSLSFLISPDPPSSRHVDVTINLADTFAGVNFPSLRFPISLP
jgi:hypothetical protein